MIYRCVRVLLPAAFSILIPAFAHAQTTLYACVNSNSGTIKIVDAATTCKTGEMKLSWDVTGPTGPQGPAGPQGPQGVQGPAGPTNVFGLSVTLTGTGTGMVTSSDTGIVCGPDCTEVYPTGTSVTLSPTPATGSTFIGWSGDCSGAGACVVTLNATRTVVAQFDTAAGPCPGGAQLTQHSTGLGQTFSDCVPLGTYNQEQATKAANAWGDANGGTGLSFQSFCGDTLVIIRPTGTQIAAWAYAGNALFVGHVSVQPGTLAFCPTQFDPLWN